MRETKFIDQNKEKWRDAENLLKSDVKDPGKLSDLFVQIVEDLSFTRTYYPNRSVRVYVNKIARSFFGLIYGHRKEKRGWWRNFWIEELPQVVIYCKWPLLISLATFIIAVAIGVFSSSHDPQFTSSILGQAYVDMTKANIEKGDPMAVYKSGHQLDMFLGITVNNLMVAFRAYTFGILFSIGTLAILLSNGIMVGCFQYFFVERGLLVESAMTIWLHGTLEISSIVLAGGAGITLGSGLLFPGNYSRLQSFQISAIRSLKLMIGITPIFVLAALIESFLTRYTEVPDVVRLVLILGSLAFIVGYFVIYPWRKNKAGFSHALTPIKLPPTSQHSVDYANVKTNAEVLQDGLSLLAAKIGPLALWCLLAASIQATVRHWLPEEMALQYMRNENILVYLLGSIFDALRTPTTGLLLANTVATSIVVTQSLFWLAPQAGRVSVTEWLQAFAKNTVLCAIAFALIYYLEGWGYFLLVITFYFLAMTAASQHSEGLSPISGTLRTIQLTIDRMGEFLTQQFALLMLGFSFLMMLTAPLLYMYTSLFRWNFSEQDSWVSGVFTWVETLIRAFGFQLVIPLLVSVAYVHFHSLLESKTAHHLLERIRQLKPPSRI